VSESAKSDSVEAERARLAEISTAALRRQSEAMSDEERAAWAALTPEQRRRTFKAVQRETKKLQTSEA
jgi:hypothetical protein